MVADREPVQREGEFLLRRRGRPLTASSAASASDDGAFHDQFPFSAIDQSMPSAHGAHRCAASTTRPYSTRPTIEIQISAAKATEVFMLLWVVMMT